jgi:hypothetical protein
MSKVDDKKRRKAREGVRDSVKVPVHRCIACGSPDTRPVRGSKGGHWWYCLRCGEEF